MQQVDPNPVCGLSRGPASHRLCPTSLPFTYYSHPPATPTQMRKLKWGGHLPEAQGGWPRPHCSLSDLRGKLGFTWPHCVLTSLPFKSTSVSTMFLYFMLFSHLAGKRPPLPGLADSWK